MRRILLSLLLAFITITAFSQSGVIVVTVVSSESGTGLTTINYEFTGQLNKRYNISVEVKFDAASYVQVPEAHLSGDITDVSGTGTAFSGTIVWNGAAGFPELYHEQTRIRILATMITSTDIVDVTNPTTGKTWMDRNLGASRAATSSTDAEAYGDLYQWGRGTDGHEKRTSPTTPILSDNDNPVHGNFIVTSSSPNDWRSSQNDNLWQGINGINNPCPSGYRIPSIAEWNAERLSWGSNDPEGAFGSQLKLSVGGSRHPVNASLGSVGQYGIYWSSAVSGPNSQYLIFGSGDAVVSSANRANGYSVRCIKGAETLSTVTTSSTSNITTSTATSGGNVVSDGGVSVTARGVCWNTTGNPTIADSKTTDAAGYGTYTSSITGLTASTIYYVRAYATNSVGTAYGEAVQFTTAGDGRDHQTAVVDVTNPLTGKTWMDRNLGASRAATSSTDAEAYGDLYQWGRAADGHEKRNAGVTSIQSTNYNPGHGNYITSNSGYYDWLSSPNNSLWQGESGLNNPCPEGYRLPTVAEWTEERVSWISNNPAGAFASPLKFTVGGGRSLADGSINSVGVVSYYWTSSINDVGYSWAERLLSTAAEGGQNRASGFSLRCIRDSAD